MTTASIFASLQAENRLIRGGLSAALVVAAAVLAAPTSASAENDVTLRATVLTESTPWCSIEKGVPVTIYMDGPDIIEGPMEWPQTVKERKGANASVRIVTGERTASFWSDDEVVRTPVGRFSAMFRTCRNLWGESGTATGNWRLKGSDGAVLEAGALKNERFHSIALPFFRGAPGPSAVRYAQFGEHRLFSTDISRVTRTQSFAAEPDKE